LLLGLVQIPGAAFDSFVRRGLGNAGLAALATLAISGLVLWRWTAPTFPRGRGAAAVVAAALAGAALSAQISLFLLRYQVREVAELGVLVPSAGRFRECRGAPAQCQELVVNDLGLRGTVPPPPPPGTRRVALVGDSYVFGSGVAEEEALPAAIERLLAGLQPPVQVVNAGIPGVNGGSFAAVIAHVRHHFAPDLIAVLLKDDDLDATDKFTRWARFRNSFAYRLLAALNLELAWETARQAWRAWFASRDDGATLRATLDAIAAATEGTDLLLVVALTRTLQPELDTWLAAHPTVASVASWNHPEFWQAEKIPGDGHWTARGCAAIAAIVAPALRQQLATLPAGADR
jgi:hypothetical protein